MRLNRFLAAAGLGSRRSCEELVLRGSVSVNGTYVRDLATRISPDDDVRVHGRTVHAIASRTILLNKPAGYTTTRSDRHAERTIFDLLPSDCGHLFHVGRLDRESEGLILLTNDGDLAHRATHPSYGLKKKYLVEIKGLFGKSQIAALLEGVELEDGLARALEVTTVREIEPKHYWVEVTIHEGRFHIVRRMFDYLEVEVLRLIRTDFGPINIGEIKSGRWRALSQAEIEKMFNALSLKR